MSDSKAAVSTDPDTDAEETATQVEREEAPKMSRLERLKAKIKKLQGKDPDIYPMW